MLLGFSIKWWQLHDGHNWLFTDCTQHGSSPLGDSEAGNQFWDFTWSAPRFFLPARQEQTLTERIKCTFQYSRLENAHNLYLWTTDIGWQSAVKCQYGV